MEEFHLNKEVYKKLDNEERKRELDALMLEDRGWFGTKFSSFERHNRKQETILRLG